MAKAAKSDRAGAADRAKPNRTTGRSRRWAVLLLVAVWMFVLGVLVGRGTSPVHFDIEALQEELSSLREAVLEKNKSRFHISERGSAKQAEDLEFYENLKKSAPEKPAAPVVKSAPKPQPKPETGSGLSDGVEKKAPAEKRPKPSREAASGTDKPLTIQVASLKDAKTADAMVESLRMRGFPAYRERADLGAKGTWHRVRIGSYLDAADASSTLGKLKAAGMKPLLIKK